MPTKGASIMRTSLKQTLIALATVLVLFAVQQLWLGSAVQNARWQLEMAQNAPDVSPADYGYQMRSLQVSIAHLNQRLDHLNTIVDRYP
jgi:hypothetical protein